jgi:flagellar motor switch protein FliG
LVVNSNAPFLPKFVAVSRESRRAKNMMVVDPQAGNLRKAAVLLMSLEEDTAVQLLAKLDAKQVEAVSIEIARLGHVTGDEQNTVIHEFADVNPTSLGIEGGGLQAARSLVEKALGKNATATLDSVRQSIEQMPFGFLKKVDSQNLLTFIVDEHPQTIALILCHVQPQQAAAVMAGLPPERQNSVIHRIATMGQTNPDIIREVEEGLSRRMSTVMGQSFDTAGGVNSVAEILNVIDRATERALLENLGQKDPELVEEIRRLMFVFDDIGRFTDKDIQTVLKNVDTSQWALALKGASEDLKQKVLGNLSKRAADLLREEMEFLGPVRLSAVEQTQQQIVDVIRRLEDAGELQLHNEQQDEQFIQ